MIKTAQEAYVAGRQAALEKLANPADLSNYVDDMGSSNGGSLNNLGLALGGGALAYQGLKGLDRALPHIKPNVLMALADKTNNPRIVNSAIGSIGKALVNPNLYASKIPVGKTLGSLGLLGLGAYGGYKGISHLLGDD